jgi:CrcB protein
VSLRIELRELLLVASGAIPGALLRWQAGVQLAPVLPFGAAGADLLVNLIGSFLLGYIAAPPSIASSWQLALGIGFCGSLTTFSSWMLDLALLQRQGLHQQALAVLVLSLGFGVLAAATGFQLRSKIRQLR